LDHEEEDGKDADEEGDLYVCVYVCVYVNVMMMVQSKGEKERVGTYIAWTPHTTATTAAVMSMLVRVPWRWPWWYHGL
jgi:hypothetical protein